MDSTTIKLCLSLCSWAKNRPDLAGIKLHTAIDLAGEIPQFAVFSPSQAHDLKVQKRIGKACLSRDQRSCWTEPILIIIGYMS
jgi:hypothetical protein